MVAIGTVILAVGTPIISLLLLNFIEDGGLAVIVGKLVIEAGLGLCAVTAIVRKSRKIFSKFYWSYAVKNNTPLVPYYLSQIVLNHSDRLMINYMCSAGQAGIYSVAYSAAMLLTVINTAINNSIVPWEFKKLKNKETKGLHESTFVMMELIMGLNAILIALAPEAMKILAAPQYYDAIWIIPPVAVSSFLLFVSQQFINIEFFFEENKYAALSSVQVAVINVILNYIFLDKFGYLAAGYTTLFSYMIFCIIHYCSMLKVVKKHLGQKRIWKGHQIVLLLLAFLAFSTVMLFCYKFAVIRYISVVIIMVVVVIKKRKIMAILQGNVDVS